MASLRDIVDGLPDEVDPRTKLSWHIQLQETDPELYDEMVEMIIEWNNRGPIRKKFKTISSMFRFLAGKDDSKIDPPVVTCGLCQFMRFAREIR